VAKVVGRNGALQATIHNLVGLHAGAQQVRLPGCGSMYFCHVHICTCGSATSQPCY
jgi:hypothetical protein